MEAVTHAHVSQLQLAARHLENDGTVMCTVECTEGVQEWYK
jgi:hypothetical protein